MNYEWDGDNARSNFSKHGVHLADAVSVLEDARALTVRDLYSPEEERWITLGLDALGRILLVIWTWRGEQIRLISARRATRKERRQYEEGL
jgi:uncharacterized DUF497 family protein